MKMKIHIKILFILVNINSYLTNSTSNNETITEVPFAVHLLNASAALPLKGKHIFEEIYDRTEKDDNISEKFEQIGSWLSKPTKLNTNIELKESPSSQSSQKSPAPPSSSVSPSLSPLAANDQNFFRTMKKVNQQNSENLSSSLSTSSKNSNEQLNNDYEDREYQTQNKNKSINNSDESIKATIGTRKEPDCARNGRYYCNYNEEYPIRIVTEITRYYKWPLEKLFRDLRHQVMPKLANDNVGGLVCDSMTRIIRPGWVKNTNNHWLVVINTDHYEQFVTEILCRNGPNSHCNFIPPCYKATCQQRYNTQKLLVIDPYNPYKGPFLSEFLFPSCCICFVPSSHDYIFNNNQGSTRNNNNDNNSNNNQNDNIANKKKVDIKAEEKFSL